MCIVIMNTQNTQTPASHGAWFSANCCLSGTVFSRCGSHLNATHTERHDLLMRMYLTHFLCFYLLSLSLFLSSPKDRMLTGVTLHRWGQECRGKHFCWYERPKRVTVPSELLHSSSAFLFYLLGIIHYRFTLSLYLNLWDNTCTLCRLLINIINKNIQYISFPIGGPLVVYEGFQMVCDLIVW